MNADPEVRRWFPGTLTREQSDTQAARLQRHISANGFGFWAVQAQGIGRAPAANEPGCWVEAALSGPVRPSAEIAEVVWLDAEVPGSVALAPLTREHVLPRLRTGQAPER